MANTEMRDFTIDRIENSEKTLDAIRKEFVKKFGIDNLQAFEDIVSEIVD